MIFGQKYSWYLKIIEKNLLIVAGIIVATDLFSLLPLIGWIFSLTTLMAIKLVKLGGAGISGYQTVKKQQGSNLQASISGGFFGFGIGLTILLTNLLKTVFRPNLTNLVFSGFWSILILSSETVTGLILGFIGGVLVYNNCKNKGGYMLEKPIGKISHYYDKIGVAVVDVLAPIKTGDEIKISGHDKEFTQKVAAMQIEHQEIKEAKKSQIIGLKVNQPVKEGDLIFKA